MVFGSASTSTQQTVCGSILNSGLNQLAQGDVTYQSTQWLGRFLQSTSEYKSTVAVQAAARDPTVDFVTQRDNSMFLVPSVCKYRLNSGSAQAIAIQIEDFTPGQNGHLLIYGGLNGSDALIYDSNAPRKYLANGKFAAIYENGVLHQRASITAPCGRATIVLQVNSTAEVTGAGGTNVPYIDHGLRLLYNTVDGDSNQLCASYCKFLPCILLCFDKTPQISSDLLQNSIFYFLCLTIFCLPMLLQTRVFSQNLKRQTLISLCTLVSVRRLDLCCLSRLCITR